MLADDSHPEVHDLTRFALGRLSDAESAPIEEHVAHCEACRHVLESTPPDALVSRVHDVGRRSPPTLVPSTNWGDYELIEEIGRGGAGIVYKARQLGLNRIVALKMLRDGLPTLAEDGVRFHAEAAAVARLRHPHIVQIHEFGERDRQPYLALEYLDGGTLARRLAGQPLPPSEAAALVETLARAVDHAHANGIIHRDLKPANILFQIADHRTSDATSRHSEHGRNGHHSEADGRGGNPTVDPRSLVPKIADFGLAKFVDAPNGPTRTGAVLGTPSYMAPEQTTGSGDAVGPAIDIYALGAILYECLTGRPPFRAATLFETLEQVRANEPASVRVLQPGTPRDLETICQKCLRKEPARRYASARELADDLRRFLTGEPILARRVGTGERARKWVRRKPAQAALLGLCAVMAAVAVIGAWAHNARLRVEVDRADSERRRAAEHYREARATLRRVLAHGAPGVASPKTRVTEVRLQQLEDAITFHRAAADADADDPEARHDLATAHLAAALELSLQGRGDRAEPHLLAGRALLEQLVSSDPGRHEYRRTLGLCYSNLGFLRDRGRESTTAISFHKLALDVRERLAAEDTADDSRYRSLAESCLNVGNGLLAQGDVRAAEAYYRRAHDLWVEDHRIRPGPYSALSLAECKTNLALVTSSHERPDEAAALYSDIGAVLLPIVDDPINGNNAAIALATANLNFANLLRAARRTDDMLARFAEAESFLLKVEQREPTWLQARSNRYNLHGARALAFTDLSRHADALRDWDRALLAATTEPDRDRIAMYRLFTLLHLGNYESASDEAARIDSRSTLDAATRYNLACVFAKSIPLALADDSVKSDVRATRAERLAQQALASLTACRDGGFFKTPAHLANLREDADLTPLRSRADFQALLQSLGGSPGANSTRSADSPAR